MIRKLVALTVVVFGLLVGTALADAPDPIPSATQLVSSTTNIDGSLTITIKGQWQWPTHNSDCNRDRSGVGYAVAWNDPADPGNFVGNNNLNALVGTTMTTLPTFSGQSASWFQPNLQDGNVAHAAMPGNDPGLGPTVTYNPANNGGVPTQTDANNWISSCGTFASHTVTGNNGQPQTKSFNMGTWGPISHTYAASDKGAITVCPIMYDPHQGPAGMPNGNPGQITAGGNGHNGDNSIETNGDTPLGNGCFTTTFARIATQASSGAAAGGTITDKATVTGNSPTGTVSWNVYGPGDTTCKAPLNSTPLSSTLASVNSTTATATSPPFTATKPGSYIFVATYSGDSNNQSLGATSCSDPNEASLVGAATPSIMTTATPSSAQVNSQIGDQAVITGGDNPQGTLTWQLVDSSCNPVAGVSTVSKAVTGDNSYNSPTTAAPAAPGTFFWTATFKSSDGNNNNVGPVGCNDPNEQVVISSTPTFSMAKVQTIDGSGQPFTPNQITGLVGQKVDYQITATNTGNVPLTFAPLTDTPCDAGTISGGPTGAVAPGATTTWTCTHTLTTADQSAGSFTNVASTTGTPTSGGSPIPGQSNKVVVVVPTPNLTIVKSQLNATSNPNGSFTSNPITGTVGDTIQYLLTVANTGTVPLKLAITDPHCDPGTLTGPSGGQFDAAGELEGGSTTTFMCHHVLVAGDVPSFTNTGSVIGTPPSGPPVTPQPSSVVVTVTPTPPPANPAMTTTKEQKLSTDPDSAYTTSPITAPVGSMIDYRIVIANTGTVGLVLAPLNDPHCDANTITGPTGSLPNGQLAPGTSVFFSCSHVVAAGDVPAFTNVATETGTPPGGTPITQVSSVVANVPQQQVAACVASTATIKVTKNTKKAFVVQVGGANITKVVFKLDGKTIKTLTAPNASGGKYRVTVNPSKKSFGAHHIVATVSESCGPAQVKAASFKRPAPAKKITPKFTG